MITVECEQGSQAWLNARLGIPTASQFDRILSPKTLKPSASAEGYRHELLAEWLLGEPIDTVNTEWMQRGIELEPRAVQFYEFQRDIETTRIGFCLTDDRLAGCSPDRLVGDDGGLEIKCPSAKVHVGYLIDGVAGAHIAQVQGCMWVTGRAWWDVMSFNPSLPPSLVRVQRDAKFMAALDEALPAFTTKLGEMREKLTAMGCTPKPPKKEPTVARRKTTGGPPIKAEAVPEMKGASSVERFEGLVDYVATTSGMSMGDAGAAVGMWMLDKGYKMGRFDQDEVWRTVRESATVHEWKTETVTA